MPRKKKEPPKRDLATIGREVLAEQKEENIVAVAGFEVGEAVQYWTDDSTGSGWKFGHVIELPSKGLNKGRARVKHSIFDHKVWVDGTGLRKV